ncbi:MAG: hypothetical protein K6F00_09380, partial [Lachnospiraceae bacterium]|nr:hypothetical protein [Lachnospiraceae bacterium]
MDKKYNASYTVEASLLMPVFACVMAFALLFFDMMICNCGIESAIRECAFKMSVCGKSNEDSSLINKASVIAVSDLLIAKNKVPTNYIFGSYLGLDYSDT